MMTAEDREKLGDIRHCIECGGELYGWVPKWLCDKIAELEAGHLPDAPVDTDRKLYRFTADVLVVGVSNKDALAVLGRFLEELSRHDDAYDPTLAGDYKMTPFQMPPP